MCGKQFDAPLCGTIEEVNTPVLSKGTVLDGSFQNDFSTWLDSNIPLKGVYTRNYNTLEYYLFNQGRYPVGRNKSIFQTNYLECKLSYGKYDCNNSEINGDIENFVSQIEDVNSKLKEYGKSFYVYIAPSKADFCFDDIPYYYYALDTGIDSSTKNVFVDEITNTAVPHLICSDLKGMLEYPAFYSSGIHWSRTYEQIVSKRVLDDIIKISGKNARTIELGDAESSSMPFWRDSDIYGIMNVWGDSKRDIYYSYSISPSKDDELEPLYILLQGDSFGEGLKKDVEENLPEDKFTIVNRAAGLTDFDGNSKQLHGDWANFDWQYYLDWSDVVIIEITEPEIIGCTYGFIDALNNYLDEYVPKERSSYNIIEFDANDKKQYCGEKMSGIYKKFDGYSWTSDESEIDLCNANISSMGLQIDFDMPYQLFDNGKVNIDVYVNDKWIKKYTYEEMGSKEIIIYPGEYAVNEDDKYHVKLKCSQTFNPKNRGENNDNRDLALQLKYIGGVK